MPCRQSRQREAFQRPPNSKVDASLAQGRTWIAQARDLQLLTTYEQRIRRSIEKNTDDLKALQAERNAAIEHAEREARLLVQLADYEGNNYDPATDFTPEFQPPGFVFSRPAILRPMERENHLKDARYLNHYGSLPGEDN